jgi:CO/xanthine dehydrogenase Mo-binding subunit
MGQGLLTICIQIASDITGIDPRLIDARVDTTFALGCGQTTGSRATVFSGNAVAIAARHLRAALDAGETLDGMKGRVSSRATSTISPRRPSTSTTRRFT